MPDAMRNSWIRPGAFVFLVCLTLPGQMYAQEPLESGRKSGTYLQTGLAHGQGDLSNKSSLARWDVALFGTDYDLVSAKLEVESYFGDTLLQLSGFSLGYRKDGLRRAEPGHMLSGSVFRDLDLKVFAVKLGAGVEWGMPSLNFDQTEFRSGTDGTVRYRHTSIQRKRRRALCRYDDRRSRLSVYRGQHRPTAIDLALRDRDADQHHQV